MPIDTGRGSPTQPVVIEKRSAESKRGARDIGGAEGGAIGVIGAVALRLLCLPDILKIASGIEENLQFSVRSV